MAVYCILLYSDPGMNPGMSVLPGILKKLGEAVG